MSRMDSNKETAHLRELAYVRRRPVTGRGVRGISSKAVTSKAHYKQGNPENNAQDNKSMDFVYYSDSEEEDTDAPDNSYPISCNFVDCIQNR